MTDLAPIAPPLVSDDARLKPLFDAIAQQFARIAGVWNAGVFTRTINTGSYTVATLPVSPSVGDRAFVTNANSTTFASIVAAGGTDVVPVFYNGTNWIIG